MRRLTLKSPRIGFESGMKFFVPLLVIFLLLADTGVYYAFSRLVDLMVDEFDKRLLVGTRLARGKLDLDSIKILAEKRADAESTRMVRQALRSAAGEGRFLNAMVVARDLEVLADSRSTESPVGAVLGRSFPDLAPVWSGEDMFANVRGEDYLWTRYVFVPLSDGKNVIVALAVGSDFSAHQRLTTVVRRYMLTRMLLLVFLVGAVLLFVASALRPFMRLKKTAEVVRAESSGEEDSEFIISTFQKVIEELKVKETELQALLAEQRHRTHSLEEYNEYILSSMSGGIVSADSSGKVTTFNRAAGEMLGRLPEKAVGLAYNEALGIPALVEMMEETLKRRATRVGTEVAVPGEKGETHLSVSSSLIRGDSGEVVGAALLLTDMTELKRLQEIVLIREKLASLGEMSAGIAHQFKNSLGSIIGYANLLKKRGESGSTIDKILKESRMLNEVVDAFLSFAKPVKMLPARVDLRALVEESLESFREEILRRGVECKSSPGVGGLSVMGDPVLLKQALANLVRNGLDAMPDGGVLNIECSGEKDTAVLTIRDTGRGIPRGEIAHVFTPFFSLTEGGVGLGLPIAHKIITSHGGGIEIESELGSGTTVTVRLPLKEGRGE